MASWLANLPPVRGLLQEKVNLGRKSWFGVGGPAEVLFVPEDMDDLVAFLRNIPDGVKFTILGATSNVLVRSGGIRGIVIILGDWFKKIFIENDILEVGAAVHCAELSMVAMDRELGGLEFLSGIPGTIGGAIKMNAGCHGSEIADILMECEAVTLSGQVKWFKISEMGFAYRTSKISNELIVTRAWFRGIQDVDYSIAKKNKELLSKRSDSQPINMRTCGSAFKNPDGKKAWELIEAAGCRGMRFGGAAISDKHCNFIVNENNATPEDIETLGEKVIEKVFENSGIRLEWEIIRLGEK
ncbi:MAG: UDP-N-acetylmuramate dehydrogenase [Holosporaceae bacterium]|nr:UDP-N-acetylmuramate dehydrogenase [Holosporaceae bacterium]